MAAGRFVAYYRVSTAKQGASGLGLEAQQAAVSQYLNGGDWQLVAEYTEVESGRRNDRPELAKAVAHARREKATLVIAKLDRLGRRLAKVAELLDAKDVEFVAVDNPHANKTILGILAVMAQWEAEQASARTKAALAAAKARGKVLGNPKNLTAEAQRKGADARRVQAMEQYRHLVHLAENLRGKGKSFRQIADHLNELGEVTTAGKPFQAMTVRRMLGRAGEVA